MRFFGGLSIEETAEALHVSRDTVKRDWKMAKLWLLRELKPPNAMTPDRWRQIEDLCHAALARGRRSIARLPGATRVPATSALRREVESLLAHEAATAEAS